ncbi:hypothetical protein FB45DRAFT_1126382 [Roridomyces roridus]|uniref:Uncharacterized protein n=1 Tax=Roridomyces roridus TaxID=1738132 RepID=A0AAD7C8U2_9AGAR|nr:hypothetical protein FB45DRAFT_1126382 [Roridomyces roridus]
MTSLRRILVDDTEASIQYSPQSWFPVDTGVLNNGNFGPVYNATSHATTSNNASFTYAFNGTSILVQGNIDLANTDNITDPTWNCSVDGQAIPTQTFSFPESNWPLCEQDALPAGEHVLSVQVHSRGQPFYFDSLIYTPLPGATLRSSAVMLLVDGDAAVNYSPGWFNDDQQMTQTPGAQVTLNFQGTSATIVGLLSNSYPPNATSASYVIDGGQPVSFPLNEFRGGSSSTQYNIPFLTTPTLPYGSHVLTVTYGGDRNHTPLGVKYFSVTTNSTLNDTPSKPVASLSPSSAPSTNFTPNSSPRTRTGIGIVVGGVVVVLVVLALAIIGVWLVWRRRRQSRNAHAVNMLDPYPGLLTSAHTGVHAASRREKSQHSGSLVDRQEGTLPAETLEPPPGYSTV